MTYNIKGGGGVSQSTWLQRFNGTNGADGVKGVIGAANPDILTLQEVEVANGIAWSAVSINESYVNNGNYMRAGTETTWLLWKASRFSVYSAPTETDYYRPDLGCATGGRYAVSVTLRDVSSGYHYFVVAAHLTAGGAACNSAREYQVGVIRNLIANRPPGTWPVVLGDFNSETTLCSSAANGKTVTDMLAAGATYNLKVVGGASLPCGSTYATFNKDWDASTANDTKRIDFVFYNNTLNLVASHTDKRTTVVNGIPQSGSDHYGMWATLTPP